jgi:uncharacterized protein (TIGR03086 family)
MTTTPASRHRAAASRFAEAVSGVVDWDAPAPVAGWTARDVVHHLVGWSSGFLAGGAGVALPPPDVQGDPAAVWDAHCRAVQALLDDADLAAAPFEDRHLGQLPLEEAVDRFYTPDVVMHTWDLARAAGLDDRLDPEVCGRLLQDMLPFDAVMRASGQYGPRLEAPAGAGPQEQLLAFIGRDAAWRPPG